MKINLLIQTAWWTRICPSSSKKLVLVRRNAFSKGKKKSRHHEPQLIPSWSSGPRIKSQKRAQYCFLINWPTHSSWRHPDTEIYAGNYIVLVPPLASLAFMPSIEHKASPLPDSTIIRHTVRCLAYDANDFWFAVAEEYDFSFSSTRFSFLPLKCPGLI